MSNDDPKESGRLNCGSKKITTEQDERHMVRLAHADRFTTATQIQQAHFPDISVHTVRRRLCEKGLKVHAPAKKPILNERLRTVRCQWAQDHLHWTFEDWTRIAFRVASPKVVIVFSMCVVILVNGMMTSVCYLMKTEVGDIA